MRTLIAAVVVACAAATAYAQEKYGTTLEWEKSIDAAAAKAKKGGRLLLLLHISGKFEDPNLT